MPPSQRKQILHVGVDVGGTFTDLVAWDGDQLHIAKIPSTPPEFHLAVIEAVRRIQRADRILCLVHGSTVATNALLQRKGEPIAFVTTQGFRDMLLIGRQNRPKLYALHVERPRPIVQPEQCFTVRERIDAHGNVIEALSDDEVDRVIQQIQSLGLKHGAVCLLFSFVNPAHERMLGAKLQAAGMSLSLSCDVMPEFREYERASTTAINAALRPIVQAYLASLEQGLMWHGEHGQVAHATLKIMHSGGGTMRASEAATHAARLVLSGPAGGVIGAAFVAERAGFKNIISYDMGGTSTDVATVIDGKPQWTTSSTIDGLPLGLPMFEINTIGAGGGSIAYIDAGGALRVGPNSAGAVPGPACYARGGSEPTVTDANVVLGRIVPGQFLGGAMKLDVEASHRAIENLAHQINKNPVETALGIVRVVEANMAHAVRAVTSRRGRDPRQFALVSFGGAGGLHACGLAGALDIPQVLVPPYCGVLSALGMIVAPPVVDVSQTILSLSNQLDDRTLAQTIQQLRERSAADLSDDDTESIECFADVRFKGQSHELTLRVNELQIGSIIRRFHEAYHSLYGHVPKGRAAEIVSLRLRRVGAQVGLALPALVAEPETPHTQIHLIDNTGEKRESYALIRAALLGKPPLAGGALIIDAEATTYVPNDWQASVRANGMILLNRSDRAKSLVDSK